MASLQGSHSHQSNVSVQQFRQTIWNNIARLRLQIADQKRQLNSVVPIACLNADVLVEIFIQCALSSMFDMWEDEDEDEDEDEEDERESDWKAYRWLSVTRVCHYWRSVALNSPRLWSHFRLKNSVPLMRVMFERSKRAPLCLEMQDYPSLYQTKVLDLVTQHLDRTQILTITASAGSMKPTVAVPAVAPKLTHFTLAHKHSYVDETSIIFEHCDMPRLSYLKLHEVAFSWKSPVFRESLTRLIITKPCAPTTRIQGNYMPPTKIVPSVTFVEALGHLLRLEHLELEDYSEILSVPASQKQMLRLPQLRLLKLTEKAAKCASFINHIIHPDTTRLAFTMEFGDSFSWEFQKFSEAIAPVFHGASVIAQSARSAVFTELPTYHQGVRIMLYPPQEALETLAANGNRFCDSKSEPLLDIAFRYPTERARYGRVPPKPFIPICRSLPLPQVEKLYIGTNTAEMSEWTSATSLLPNIRELVLHPRCKDWSIPQFLATNQKGPDATSNASATIFPRLKTLILYCVEFRPDYRCMEDEGEADAYYRMLTVRKDAGCAVEELILHQCYNMSTDDVQRLQGVVERVTWDPEKVRRTWPLSPMMRPLPYLRASSIYLGSDSD